MRSDLAQRLGEAGACAGWQWSAEREQAVWEGVQHSTQSPKRAVRLMGSVAAVAVVMVVMLVGWLGMGKGDMGRPTADSRAASSGLLVQLDDGSTVTAVDAEARVEPVRVGPQLVEVRLHSGTARFSVKRRPDRLFRVLAGDYSVTVLGTVFTVTLLPENVTVEVEQGSVMVAGPMGSQRLDTGMMVGFPRGAAFDKAAEAASQARAEQELVQAPPAPEEEPTLSVHRARLPSWRELARRGEYEKAYERLQVQGKRAVRNDAGDLLLIADVARLSGHPSAAEPPLRRVLREHAGDSRATLAAFTLGRVLLDDLGRPDEAAKAFGWARRSAPSGALAQDALAREVESWSKAGDVERAAALARIYLRDYPMGARAKAVKQFGGITE